MNLTACKCAAGFLSLCAAVMLLLGLSSASGVANPLRDDAPGADDQRAPAIQASAIDKELADVLRRFGFTGRIASTLEQRLGRSVNHRLADLGRLLWFDTLVGLNDDNTCAGCHSPTRGFGDTQSIAIGIDNNAIVGPNRAGPRNQRRSPVAINAAFYPNLMWNSRFASLSNDPFDNSAGFKFPPPEGLTLSNQSHLLAAQAFIPPTERNEAAGFAFPGNNFDIRAEVLRRLNATPGYRVVFGRSFPEVEAGGPITFDMFGAAIAEFEFTLVFADAPLDRFARGERRAMSPGQKKGALLFFGKAGCVGCHAVSGASNEMFSDFRTHVIGVPQIAPAVTNSVFDGLQANEDFGLEQVTGNAADRYQFRTTPLRNLSVMPAFMHNGCFITIEEAVRHHLDVFSSARAYTPDRLDPDLQGPLGPIEPMLERLDPRLTTPVVLSNTEFRNLVDFLREGLLDPRALPENLRSLVPDRLPSGRWPLIFEFPEPRLATVAPSDAEELRRRPVPVGPQTPARLSLALRVRPPQPNPATGSASFAIDLPREGEVDVFVLDPAGRRVRRLMQGRVLAAGSHRLVWDGRNDDGATSPAGVYFVCVRAGSVEGVQRFAYLGP